MHDDNAYLALHAHASSGGLAVFSELWESPDKGLFFLFFKFSEHFILLSLFCVSLVEFWWEAIASIQSEAPVYICTPLILQNYIL